MAITKEKQRKAGPSGVTRVKQKPGPKRADAPLQADQEMADAAQLTQQRKEGSLRISKPKSHRPQISTKRAERLNAQEENELALKVQNDGDLNARNALVVANLGLVHLVANQYHWPQIRYEDLVQEGTLGLIRATETFEPGRNVRFSTYSVYWIRAKIQRLIQKVEKESRPSIAASESIEENGKKRKPRKRSLSLEQTMSATDSRPLIETLASDMNAPEEIALIHEKRAAIQNALESIIQEVGDERLRTIIQWRLLADEPETLAQVGSRLNLSREGARLLESKMLRLARKKLLHWQETVS